MDNIFASGIESIQDNNFQRSIFSGEVTSVTSSNISFSNGGKVTVMSRKIVKIKSFVINYSPSGVVKKKKMVRLQGGYIGLFVVLLHISWCDHFASSE